MKSSVRLKTPNRISNLAAVKKTNHAATKPDSSTDGTPVGASGGGGLFASCSFADLGLHPTLCQELQERLGFKAPTTIQAQAIPVAISGRHVLVNAATGTGKTIAYLTPIVHLLQMHSPKIQRGDGTFALVLVPTRELCTQVYEILQTLLHRFHWIVPGYVMGGEKKSKEKSRLRKGISILIATPGRLLDHLKNTSSFSYKNLRWIVFDEADSILELGFGKAIEEILEFLDSKSGPPSKREHGPTPEFPRQHLLLSATLNEKVNQLANISLDNPVMIRLDNKVRTQLPTLSVGNTASEEFVREYVSNVSTASSSHAIEDYNFPEQLVQRYVKVPCGSRLVVLASILKTSFERDLSQKIVVFFSTCDAVDFHHSLFGQFCWSFDSRFEQNQNKAFLRCQIFHLHGKMKHEDRRTNFQGFSSEKSALLLCTDVAARGLDFPNVRCIIQYDSPGEATEYVHRVGRTARLGEKGEAILFLQPIELDYLHDLKRHGLSLEEFPAQKIMDDLLSQSQKHWNRHNPSLDMHPWVLVLQKALESCVSRNSELQELAKDAFASWVKAYSAHRGDLKRIFMVKKLHLGHVARSFGLKEQPSLVGRSLMVREKKKREAEGRSLLRMQEKIKREQKKSASSGVQVKSRKRDQMKGKLFMMQVKKRKRDQKQGTSSKRKRVDR